MTFDTYFRATSYAMVACGAAALTVSGAIGFGLFAAFLLLLAGAWKLEGWRWQVSERAGLVVVLASLPLFFLYWRLQSGFGVGGGERVNAALGVLVQFTLFLSVVKLLQKKADRDWLFLYLLSFFEVLLAAGLTLSPLFIAALTLYMFCALLTIICFELKKARTIVAAGEVRLLVAHDPSPTKLLLRRRPTSTANARVLRRLPPAALCLLVLIFALALPIFFLTPRFGEGSGLAFAGGGATGYVGFSDRVTLGEIGRLQRSDRIVMRVRLDDPGARRNQNLRWRGVALDSFDGRAWSRSNRRVFPVQANERDLFQFGTTEHLNRLTTQTFFVEPIDTPVLFAAPRAVAVQGELPFVRRDAEDALTTSFHPQERLTYRAYSDTVEPAPEILRADRTAYPERANRYLLLPAKLDSRTGLLAAQVIERAGARSRYDMARAVESHLNNNYGYTLDLRAGGDEPLADFLFNVREGHCEYFATAMAVMLRTQGVASRVVNGFSTGEYNDAADAYTVRQSNAHSWVEVYFPETDSWATFDPTPPAGRGVGESAGGIGGRLNKYAEALELFWIQYVVAYDRQEQRTLVSSLRQRWRAMRASAAASAKALAASVSSWWSVSPDETGRARRGTGLPPVVMLSTVLALAGALFIYARRFRRGRLRRTFEQAVEADANIPEVSFYRRLTEALEARGQRRDADQTPLEFAAATGVHEALLITRAYHRVRYGAHRLTPHETAEIEQYLRQVEEKPLANTES